MMHLLKRVRWNSVYLSRKTTRIYCQPKKQMQTERSRVISFFLKKKLTCTNTPTRRKDRRRGHAAPPECNAESLSAVRTSPPLPGALFSTPTASLKRPTKLSVLQAFALAPLSLTVKTPL